MHLKAETEIINIMDFPDELSDSVCEDLSYFSVALLRIAIDQNYENIQLIGSGTLVIVNGYHSILTAEHARMATQNAPPMATSKCPI